VFEIWNYNVSPIKVNRHLPGDWTLQVMSMAVRVELTSDCIHMCSDQASDNHLDGTSQPRVNIFIFISPIVSHTIWRWQYRSPLNLLNILSPVKLQLFAELRARIIFFLKNSDLGISAIAPSILHRFAWFRDRHTPTWNLHLHGLTSRCELHNVYYIWKLRRFHA
jgi:hypothetical protein